MLAAVAVLGVLLGLLAPAVSGALVSGREAACVAAARSFTQAVHVYAADSGGHVPAMRVVYPDGQFSWDNTMPRVRYDNPGGGFSLVEYPYQGWFSVYVLRNAGYLVEDDARCPTQRRRAPDIEDVYPDGLAVPVYSVPEAFYFRTAVYERRDPWPSLPASYRVQRLSDVRFPAEKMLVFERRAWHLPGDPAFFTVLRRGDKPVYLMTDGSAWTGELAHSAPAVFNSALQYERPVPWLTPSGVSGSDLRTGSHEGIGG
jgi:hypothetical protein